MKKIGYWIGFHFVLGFAAIPMVYASGGGWGSGGGNARVCFSSSEAVDTVLKEGGDIPDELLSQIQSIETLDLYEAKLPRGFDQTPPVLAGLSPGENFQKYYERIVQRVRNTVPELGEALDAHRSNFKNENIILHDTSLKRIHDEAVVFRTDSSKCVLATMAIQQNTNGLWFLHIDRRLFFHPAHSEISRAILLLHEVTYAVARDRGQSDSYNSRLVVAQMISNDPDGTVAPLIELSVTLGFLDRQDDFDPNGPSDPLFHSAPYRAMRSAFYMLTSEAYSAFVSGDLVPIELKNAVSGFPSRYELVQQANPILRTLGEKSVADGDLPEALAWLVKLRSRFNELNHPEEAATLLQVMEKYHAARVAALNTYLNRRYQEFYKVRCVGWTYLTAEQNAALDRVARLVITRIVELAKTVMTQQDLEKQKQAEKSFIHFRGGYGVYMLSDLNLGYVMFRMSQAPDQVTVARAWFNTLLYFSFDREGNNQLNLARFPLPTFTD